MRMLYHIVFMLIVLNGVFASSITVNADLRITGSKYFSTSRLRELLHAGDTMSQSEWLALGDSLLDVYAVEGYPFCSLHVDSVCAAEHTLRIVSLTLDEGKQLLLGRVKIDGAPVDFPPVSRWFREGRPVNGARLLQAIDEILYHLEQEGRALSTLSLREMRLWPAGEDLSLELDFQLSHIDPVLLQRVLFRGQKMSRESTLLRLSRLKEGMRWDPVRARDANRRLLATGWFQQVQGPTLCRGPEGELVLVELDELPAYHFDGMAGLIPDTDEKGSRFAFHLQLDLDNILGTGRRLNLLGSRPDGVSQELQFKYREPFLFGQPLAASLEMRQQIQDSSWLKRSAGIELDYDLLLWLSLSASLYQQEVLPDSLNGRVMRRVDRSSSLVLGGGIEADRRDDPRNPRLGWMASLGWERIQRQTKEYKNLPPLGESSTLNRQQMRLKLWYPLRPRVVLQPSLGGGLLSGDGTLPVDEFFTLGGTAGPRGWREQSLFAESWLLGQLELRYLLGPRSRVAVFWDSLIWNTPSATNQRTHGRGVALVLPAAGGQLELQYALGESTKLSRGMLHLRLLTRF